MTYINTGKKYLFVALTLLSFTFYRCNEIDKLLTFNIKNEANLHIPSSAVLIDVPYDFPTPNIKTNSQQAFSNNNTKKDLVKDVRLSSMSLEVTNPSGKSFKFLKSITIYISADGVAEKKLAYLDNIPENVGSKIDLTPTNEKLDEIIKKDDFNIRTEITTDETIVNDLDIKAVMNFKVTADVL